MHGGVLAPIFRTLLHKARRNLSTCGGPPDPFRDQPV